MRALGLATLALALTACGRREANTYPPQYELNFMRACQAQQAPAQFCSCTWDKIEREVPPADFAAFESMPSSEQATNPLREQIARYAEECRNESAPPPEDPPPP